jgi:oligopeptide transport system substrate-binding protein
MEVPMFRMKVLALGLVAVLAACGQNQTANAPAQGETVLNRGNPSEPDSLDHHFTTSTTEHAIIGELIIGLTTDDPEGKPIPGAAERWETSDDGLTWTFHLRDHNWSDGMPVTAEDFVYAWRRVLDPKTAAPYALILYDVKNARAVNGGQMPVEQLGVRAIDAKTFEVQLEHPAAYFPTLVKHMTAFPVPRHVVERLGREWSAAGNYVGNGPYSLVSWTPNDNVTLRKNPRFYDAANVKIDRVVFHAVNDDNAGLRRFRAREFDTLDGIPADQIDWLKANMPDVVHIMPAATVAALVMNQSRKPFDDVRVREALNLTYDRDTMTATIMRTGQSPAYSVIPPGIANYPGNVMQSFKEMSYPERVRRAQGLMQQAGYGPNRHLALTFSTGPTQDARRIGAAVQQMWREIYVDTTIEQFDGRVLYNNLNDGNYSVSPYGWHADFNDPYNFLFLFLSDNELNYARYKNPAFDALLQQSQGEQDLVRRGEILARAERMLLDDHVWIPTRYEIVENLVHPYVKGWITNIDDTNRTRWLSVERPAAAPGG